MPTSLRENLEVKGFFFKPARKSESEIKKKGRQAKINSIKGSSGNMSKLSRGRQLRNKSESEGEECKESILERKV